MRLKPASFAMTILLASMTALASLSNDIYVPSLPAIAAEMHATAARTQLTLTAFLIGYAIGQIFYGPLSDKLGRKPVLSAGFGLFLIATVACALAHSIDMLILARVIQSIGASGPIIIARAIVRDLYEGARAGRELSIMASIMGISPIVAPIVGALLQISFGWRSTFVVTGTGGLLIAACCAFLLPETIPARDPGPIRFRAMLKSFGVVWAHPPFRAYAAILAVSYSGLFAFITASSFVLQDVYGLSPMTFSLAFTLCTLGFVIGTMLAARLVHGRGLDGAIGLGVFWLALGGGLELVAWLFAPTRVAALILPEMLFMMGVGLSLPHLLAAAITPFPERAGAASSLLGVIQMSSAAIVGMIMGAFLGASALPFIVTTTATSFVAFAAYHFSQKARQRRRAI